jgi:sugar/nucleoside kinase (ribokinase family)
METIHCFGVAVVDILSGPIAQYPVPRIKTQVTTKWVHATVGGGAANAPLALARMGLAVSTFFKVGNDFIGEFVRHELQKGGVDTSGVSVSRSDPTPFTFVGVHEDGERTFIHTPGANLSFCLADINLDSLLACNYLLYHDLWVLPKMDGKPAASLLAEAQSRGVVTFLDEDFGYGPNREPLEEMLPYCDYVTPSFDDLQRLYPGVSPVQMADILLARGAGTVVLKKGRDGCLLAKGPDRVQIPALPATVIDTTGAGDCWDAGFLAALATGEDLLTAARIGNACAAFCIESVGGTTGIPDYETVRQRAVEKMGK